MIDQIKELNRVVDEAKDAKEKAEAMLQLAAALISFDLEQAFKVVSEAGVLAQDLGSQKMLALSFKVKSLYYSINSKWKDAMESLAEAVKLYTAIGDNAGLAAVTMNMGIVKMNQAAYADAMTYYQQAIAFYSVEEPNAEGLAKCYNNMGIVYEQTGEYQQALQMFEKSIQCYREVGMDREAENPEGNIALVYKSLGWREQALDKLLHCLDVYGNDLNKVKYTATLLNVGDTYLELDNAVKALDYFQKAFKSAKEINHSRTMASSMVGLGKVFNKLKGFDDAKKHFEKALEIYSEINEPDGICEVYFSLGDGAMNAFEFPVALDYFEKALQIAIDHNFQHQQFEIYRVMVAVYNSMGRYEEAAFVEAKSFPLRVLYKS